MILGCFLVFLAGAVSVSADEVILDDLIVDSSLCVGPDCVEGEEFGYNTLILKSEDVRIHFDDTSTSGSFPSQDWSIIANDSVSGGQDYFAIGDGNDGQGYDFRVDPGDNSFHIMNDRIEVGLEDQPRTLSHVADGIADSDAATVGQLNPIKSELESILEAGTNQGTIMLDLQSRMNAAESDIATNRTDIDALQDWAGQIGVTGDGSAAAASATGTGSTAFGAGASARTRDTAVGFNATVSADGSVAVGANTLVESQNSVAVGADSQVADSAAGGTALGQNARVTSGASGSVALGQDSVADEANTVSVGSTGNERRITNVAAGVNASDVATVGQLQELEQSLQQDFSGVNRKIGRLEQRLDQIGAMASAFSALVPNHRDDSKTQISLGVGHYSGANAMAAGLFHSPSDRVLINTGISTSFDRNTTAGRAGITFGW